MKLENFMFIGRFLGDIIFLAVKVAIVLLIVYLVYKALMDE